MKKRHVSVSLWMLSVLSITFSAATVAAVCTVIFASVYSRELLRDAQLNAEQSVSQTTTAVNNYLELMKTKLTVVSETVNSCSSTADMEEKISAITKIESDIYAVTVYDDDGNIISCVGSGATLKKTIYKDLSFDKALFGSSGDFALSVPHVQTLFEGQYPWVVTLACRTNTPVFGSGAYIAMDISFSEIAQYIDNISIGRHGYCFVIDSRGNIVYHPHQQLLFAGLKTEDTRFLAGLSDGVHKKDSTLCMLGTTADGRWRVAGISYTDSLISERRGQIVVSIALSAICCAAIAGLTLLIYLKSVNAPVRRLRRAMKEFEKDAENFSYSGEKAAVRELDELSDSFGHMSCRIRGLMEQIKQDETILRRTELRALQAQINPHFLYNTLDSIQWMCEQGKNEEAAEMVRALARLFRISISRGRELIPIKDELRHAESYLIIQSFRYSGRFTYSFDVDETLANCLCNKITIQPFIENALYHGISDMDDGRIEISVKRAEDDSGDILISVADNGIGMTKEQCEAVLAKERSDSVGIGVKNVNDRLRIYFGDKYGITIESELDEGTCVTARIPGNAEERQNEI